MREEAAGTPPPPCFWVCAVTVCCDTLSPFGATTRRRSAEIGHLAAGMPSGALGAQAPGVGTAAGPPDAHNSCARALRPRSTDRRQLGAECRDGDGWTREE